MPTYVVIDPNISMKDVARDQGLELKQGGLWENNSFIHNMDYGFYDRKDIGPKGEYIHVIVSEDRRHKFKNQGYFIKLEP